MALSKQAIEEFNDIYQKEFGVRLSDKEATQKAIELMDLAKVLLKVDKPKEKVS